MSFFSRLPALLLSVALFLPLASLAATGETISADHVKISLVLPETFGSDSTKVAVLFEPQSHWHVYWKNPGDSGAAPKFAFSGDATIGEIQWPAPKRLPVAHLTTLGYEGSVAYLFDVTPKTGGSVVDQELKLEWLVCKEECVPGFHTFKIARPVSSRTAVWKPEAKSIADRFSALVPAASRDSALKILSARIEGEALAVTVSGFTDTPEIFPVDGNTFGAGQPQFAKAEDPASGTFLIPIMPGAAVPTAADFVLSSGDKAWEFTDVPLNENLAPAIAPVQESLVLLIFLSFIGGIILNLMPCVFPVLSIKVFSLVKGDVAPRARAREGFLYTAGVLVTFAALGAGFLALRSAGNAVGWGFQLQSPVVVLTLAILFWLMALNFLGAFEFGTSVMNVAGRSNSNSSFATGVLAVFVAAPCTGPFMGSALGAAATLPAASGMMIFLGLGLGLAAPFLAIALIPGAARILPRPGAWMETFKEFLAFPLFATVLWLLWVLGQQIGSAGWQIGSLVLLGLSFGVWLSGSKKNSARIAALIVAVAVAFFGAKELRSTPMQDSSATASANNWKPFDPSVIASARAAKQNVFIDFTAAWCITCQVNKKAVLETAGAQAAFAENATLLIRADWTDQDAKITAALAEFGRNSVPVYVFYPADGSAPKILPQILTVSMITDLFSRKP